MPVGNLAAFLVGDGAAALTGDVEYIDAGYHIVEKGLNGADRKQDVWRA